ncbi:hypothetical protein [Aquimarina agarivorans]|uniref:hypothetical protein n=1 Tax=Aquimarina agarivorans TaxID=980584 RepID=UPI000248FD54|nr:hypothetical protein [Aquimarina agarivorans]
MKKLIPSYFKLNKLLSIQMIMISFALSAQQKSNHNHKNYLKKINNAHGKKCVILNKNINTIPVSKFLRKKTSETDATQVNSLRTNTSIESPQLITNFRTNPKGTNQVSISNVNPNVTNFAFNVFDSPVLDVLKVDTKKITIGGQVDENTFEFIESSVNGNENFDSATPLFKDPKIFQTYYIQNIGDGPNGITDNKHKDIDVYKITAKKNETFAIDVN